MKMWTNKATPIVETVVPQLMSPICYWKVFSIIRAVKMAFRNACLFTKGNACGSSRSRTSWTCRDNLKWWMKRRTVHSSRRWYLIHSSTLGASHRWSQRIKIRSIRLCWVKYRWRRITLRKISRLSKIIRTYWFWGKDKKITRVLGKGKYKNRLRFLKVSANSLKNMSIDLP
jgi:hypothetical protein